jgi:hypothetical protein
VRDSRRVSPGCIRQTAGTLWKGRPLFQLQPFREKPPLTAMILLLEFLDVSEHPLTQQAFLKSTLDFVKLLSG